MSVTDTFQAIYADLNSWTVSRRRDEHARNNIESYLTFNEIHT
jgi:hypothetical protein